MYALNTLAPLLALIALGAALRRWHFAPPSFFRDANRLLYWVALPALLFYQTAEAMIQGGAALRVFLTLLAGMVASIGLGYLVALLLRLPQTSVGAFVQGAYRGNLAYVGLPAVLLALAASHTQSTSGSNSLAVLSVAFLVPIYNLIAVVVLLAGRPVEPGAGRAARRMVAAMFTNPLVLSCAAGLLFAIFGWKLPPVVRQTCATLGQMSTPLALLGIGASLTFASLRHRLVPASAASLIKVAAGPIIGYLVARWLGLSSEELRVAMIYLACPTASASYVMAQQLGADDMLAGSIIVVSTFFAVPALAISLSVGL
jgi:malate permease and related proteins